MKNKSIKFIFIFVLMFLITGCAKTLTDENKKIVKYNSDIICTSCENECIKKEEELNKICNTDEECIDEDEEIASLKKEINTCKNECINKCDLAKKNATGQNLTSNILCKPTNNDVIEIYEKYGVNINSLPKCENFKAFSNYEGLWISIFVRPLAWLIIKTGTLFNNYGLALVLISILLRVVLMPLTKKTAMQSENLKKAQPEIDRINKKYEGKTNDKDAQMQMSQETLMVYKKYKINPLSSCLFAFIQIPLLFAFIEAINRTPAIFEGRFIGLDLGITPWTALSRGSWWYILVVIILAVVTYFSLNMNKSAGGSDTEKQMALMNKIMLVFIIYASFTLSTAICIYWIASSSITVVQNLLVKRVKN